MSRNHKDLSRIIRTDKRPVILRLLATFAALLLSLAAVPAHSAVTITFWSHELGNRFPHAFFTLRGVPDAGNAPVDLNYDFTPKAISPSIPFGPVQGRLHIAKSSYMEGSARNSRSFSPMPNLLPSFVWSRNGTRRRATAPVAWTRAIVPTLRRRLPDVLA